MDIVKIGQRICLLLSKGRALGSILKAVGEEEEERIECTKFSRTNRLIIIIQKN